MRLKDWAAQQGVHYQTAWQWARDGKMPVPVVQTPTGQWLVQVEAPARESAGRTVGYARVSSHDQKKDLDGQVGRVAQGAAKLGIQVDEYCTEVGSGLNGSRPRLKRLLSDPSVKVLVVEHRDRLARFGFEYIDACLAARGGKVVVLDDAELDDDLVRDMTEVLTSFCARLYGKRGARNRAVRAAAAAKDADA